MRKSKTAPRGLKLVKGIWHIDKRINGIRVCKSCQTSNQEEAEQVLAWVIDEQRQAKLFGVRPNRTFTEAATLYLETETEGKSLNTVKADVNDLQRLMPYIGNKYVKDIHDLSLKPYIEARKKDGVKAGTINRSIRVMNHILKLCATKWRDEHGLTWLEKAVPVSQLKENDKRKPRPITWAEQDRLFSLFPFHLKEACTFAVHTGCREQEVCQLEWSWEIPLPELKTSVFVLPDWLTKNGVERIVVLNKTAMAVVNRQRGKHQTNVFTYRGRPIGGLNETSFKKQRKKAGLADVRIHDLRHTFGSRLRTAGVCKETRSDLLGHDNGNITSHYSLAEIQELYDAVEKIAEKQAESPTVTFLQQKSRKTHEGKEKRA